MNVENNRKQSKQCQDSRNRRKENREKKEFKKPMVEKEMEITRIVEKKQK